jgi:hypothetical protein
MLRRYALLHWRMEEETHGFQNDFLDTIRESSARSHIPRNENEHHQTLFITYDVLICVL